jgi:dTDP-4-amino-4,6-dideoxygalactose transaminase
MTASLPALLGSAPLCPHGPPDWPPADETVRAALEAALRDGSWGKYDAGHVRRLEERLAEGHGVGHALACGSGTFAVEVALRALRIGPGDEVALAAYDYPGNFLSVHAIGAHPVLVDVDADNWNLSVDALRSLLREPGRIRAVLVSHLHGGLVPMSELMEVCAGQGVAVIEDAAQAAGATVQGRPAGSWGDVGVLSFGGSKLLSAGRGGALLTRRADVRQRARLVLGRGNNLVCPLSELQAAVLAPQLDLLPQRHARRARAVAFLGEALADLPGLRLFRNRADGAPAYYKVGWQLEEARAGLPRARLVAAVRAEGVALDEGFRALHTGRSASRWRAAGSLEQADRTHRGALCLHHPVLLGDMGELRLVADALRRVWLHAEALTGLLLPAPRPGERMDARDQGGRGS